MQHDYDYKTEPYAHQREVFHRARDLDDFAFLMGMGTGKTKVGIDNAAWLWAQGKISALVVIAPNGVHRNWILREIPAHLPEWTQYRAAIWASPSVIKAGERKELDKIWKEGRGLRVISMNVEAFGQGMKGAGAKFLAKVMNTFNTMVIIDESTVIKTPGSARTKTLITLGKRAKYRRIMTGTPITNGPLDAYAQFAFLNRDILGFDNFYSFKHRYAEWVRRQLNQVDPKTGKKREFEELVSYRNLDELVNNIQAHSFRITKNECLDLPEKVYERRLVDLTAEQRKLYNDIRKKALYDLGNGEVTVQNVLTKLLRLQQVLGGFVPAEEFAPAVPIPGANPRLESLLGAVEEAGGDGKIIIWARFRAELEAITARLAKEYGPKSVVGYHGGVKAGDREVNIDRFQNDDLCQFFVGQQHSGGYGLTLTAATTVIYYSNDFSLEARLQSEDRAHRIGQKDNVTYIDMEAANTVDTKIINALRSKKNIADEITKDNPGEWL
jgi:SNF2 family DNA or RNA helicase